MKYFQVLMRPQDCPWDKLIQIMDVVGIWHYSRSIPDEKDYEIERFKGIISISCKRTRTKFRFDQEWRASFRYFDVKGSIKNTYSTEGTLYSACEYIEKLAELEIITLKI